MTDAPDREPAPSQRPNLPLLRKFIAHVATKPGGKFNFGTWCRVPLPELTADGLPDLTALPDLHACGSTACALGWGVEMPELRLRWVCDRVTTSNFVIEHEPSGARGVEAAMNAFGLDYGAADLLVVPTRVLYDQDLGPVFVATREGRVIAQHRRPDAWVKVDAWVRWATFLVDAWEARLTLRQARGSETETP